MLFQCSAPSLETEKIKEKCLLTCVLFFNYPLDFYQSAKINGINHELRDVIFKAETVI